MIEFALQGRLGNQIWGLSEAYRVHKAIEEKICLSLSLLDDINMERPWVDFIEKQDWLEISRTTGQYELAKEKEWIGLEENVRKQIDLGQRKLTGFVPKYSLLVSSGLYKEGYYPFEQNKQLSSLPPYVTISIRKGDYQKNPHLGILPNVYYRRAIQRLEDNLGEMKIVVLSDSKFGIKKIVPSYLRESIIDLGQGKNLFSDLEVLAKAKANIIANSTFSYLGSFFSKSKIIIMPSPFYIAIENWESNLKSERIQMQDYTRSPKLRYAWLRSKSKCISLKDSILYE